MFVFGKPAMTGSAINGAPPVQKLSHPYDRTPSARAARGQRGIRVSACAIKVGLVAALVACGVTACDFGRGKSGVTAPLDRIFLPSGAAVVNSGRSLLVVNSNSDLRYSTGTVLPLDLQAAAEDRAKVWPTCPAVDYRPLKAAGRLCCKDVLDSRVLNCDERPYADTSATVRMGSFGTAPVLQTFTRNGEQVERLLFGVRADPSITFVDATAVEGKTQLRCTDRADDTSGNPKCEGVFKVQDGKAEGREVDLPEEPFNLHIDTDLGVMYVGHLVGGISAMDVCGADMGLPPRLAGVLFVAYAGQPSGGVTSITPSNPGNPLAPVFTTARSGFSIGQVFLQAGAAVNAPCSKETARDLSLVAALPASATAFVPRGGDTRGIIYQPNRGRAFILYHNTPGNPAALSRVRVAKDDLGRLAFAPAESIDVCAGPSQLLEHVGGRGSRLYVTCFDSGQVYVIEPDSMVVAEAIDVGRGPSMLMFDESNKSIAYVTGFIDNNVSVIDLRVNSPTESRVIQRIGFPRTSTEL